MSPLLRALESISTAWRSSRKRTVHGAYAWREFPAVSPASKAGGVSVAIFRKIGESNIAPVAGAHGQPSLAGVLFLNSSDVRIVHQQEFARWRASLR
jgi:hypothetical protein